MQTQSSDNDTKRRSGDIKASYFNHSEVFSTNNIDFASTMMGKRQYHETFDYPRLF